MFVESFQGEYKDRTNGTRDFRMASASFFIVRILTLVIIHHSGFQQRCKGIVGMCYLYLRYCDTIQT